MRTQDFTNASKFTNLAPRYAFSLGIWGGATFDAAMRFLHECPWGRFKTLREKVPDVPFQMMLRSSNTVIYINYPNNTVHKFCKQASKSGVDAFRVFDSLNYTENLKLGIDAAGSAGGFMEGNLYYTEDVSDPNKGKYNLEYYINLTRYLSGMGVHSLVIKDMAGLRETWPNAWYLRIYPWRTYPIGPRIWSFQRSWSNARGERSVSPPEDYLNRYGQRF